MTSHIQLRLLKWRFRPCSDRIIVLHSMNQFTFQPEIELCTLAVTPRKRFIHANGESRNTQLINKCICLKGASIQIQLPGKCHNKCNTTMLLLNTHKMHETNRPPHICYIRVHIPLLFVLIKLKQQHIFFFFVVLVVVILFSFSRCATWRTMSFGGQNKICSPFSSNAIGHNKMH